MKISLEELRDIIVNTELPIYISIHREPDGDAIGSAVAFYKTLISMGKDAFILNVDPIPVQFNFLVSRVPLRTSMEERGILLFLDFSSINKLQDLDLNIDKDAEDVIFIDHRTPKIDTYKVYADPNASSTAEIIYNLMDLLGVEADKLSMDALYTGIISDTRSFKYSRTTSKSHLIAAELTDKGIDNEQIHRRVFSTASINELKVLGYMLLNSKISSDGKVAWSVIDRETMQKNNITRADTKGFVNQLLSIDSVEIAVLFREDAENLTKVSVRAKGHYGLNYFVRKYDGVSTEFSASFIYNNKVTDEFIKEVIDRLDRLVSL